MEGQADDADILPVWNELFREFIYKMKTEDGEYIERKVKEYNLLNAKIGAVTGIIRFVEWLLDVAVIDVDLSSFAKLLTEWTGLPISLSCKDKKQCLSVLEMVVAHTKRWWSEAEIIKGEIGTSVSGDDGKDKMDRDYFDHLIVTLSVYCKFHVNRKETTVGEFVVMVHQLRKQIDSLKTIHQN